LLRGDCSKEEDMASKGNFTEDGVFTMRMTLTWMAMFRYGNFPKVGDFARLQDFIGVGNFTTNG
jgi:hypothetical protein